MLKDRLEGVLLFGREHLFLDILRTLNDGQTSTVMLLLHIPLTSLSQTE
jgi:hypothetical protein